MEEIRLKPVLSPTSKPPVTVPERAAINKPPVPPTPVPVPKADPARFVNEGIASSAGRAGTDCRSASRRGHRGNQSHRWRLRRFGFALQTRIRHRGTVLARSPWGHRRAQAVADRESAAAAAGNQVEPYKAGRCCRRVSGAGDCHLRCAACPAGQWFYDGTPSRERIRVRLR